MMGRRELSRRGRLLARSGTLLALLGALLPATATATAQASSTPVDLTANASTVLAASMNPGVVDAFGKPYAVNSRVTAVRFHGGTTPSTAPGGLGSAPHPRLQQRNGVRYLEVTGELSGIGHSSVGFEYVYGPIDANGVDQSHNSASPRFGLSGITFRLVYLSSDPDSFQALTPRTGGNYNTPYVPASGTLADWFLVRSGVEAAFIPQPPDGHTEYFDMLPDPDYPVSAPMTYVIGEIDHPDIFINGYYLANAIAAALPGSKLQDKDINSWLRVYTLRGATHAPREAWFAGASNGGGKTWFEAGGTGYNHKGRGLELPAWMDALRANNPGIDLDWMGTDYAATLPEEGFALQAIANAERWAKTGSAPPTSAVDANLVAATPSTLVVTYPVAEDCTAEAIFGAGDLSCLQSLKADSVINDPAAGLGELDPVFVGMLQTFAAGPLRTTTSPIDLPDNAAPLGFRLFTPQPVWERPFTRKELKARYGTHAGYVAAVAKAVASLVARKLYDPVIGAHDIAAAARSSVLR